MPPTTSTSLRHALLFAWLHLAVLWTFAFGRPLFAVLEDSPEFFVARGNTTADIIALALAFTFLPPSVMLACEALLFRFPRARRVLHLMFVALLCAAVVLQIVDGLDEISGWVLVGTSLACGAAAALAYARTRVVPAVLSALSPVPVVVVLFFLLLSPVSDLVLPQEDVEASAAVHSDTPVVMVIFDEFDGSSLLDGRGRIDASRFPNFAALARGSTWYRNATTVADETTRAVPGLLSGIRVTEKRLPTAAEFPQNLFTLLGDRYALNVQEPVTDLCPESLCRPEANASPNSRLRALVDDLSVVSGHLLLPQDFEDDLPAVDRTFAGFRTGGRDAAPARFDFAATALDNRVAQFERYLEDLGTATRKPRLDFTHVALPHGPWQYVPSGKSYPASTDVPGQDRDRWVDDPWLATQGHQRYLLQVGYADRLIGRLLARLRQLGRYERSLIVVTADHGISFRPGGNRRMVTSENVTDIASVPLFVKVPGQAKGRVDDRAVRTIDVLPTVADVLGARLRKPVDGASLRRAGTAAGPVAVSSREGATRVSFRDFLRRRAAAVRRRTRLFGAGNGFAGVFAAGPYGDLVGQRIRRLSTGRSAGFRVTFDFRGGYADFDPDAFEVPSFVTARLTGSARGGEYVAIAVNGRVAAVTRSYRRNGDQVLAGAMVSPAAFRPGANTVEALAVSGSPANPQLASAGRVGGRGGAELRSVDGREMLSTGGRTLPLEAGPADGYVRARAAGDRLTVSGWATDGDHSRPAERVLLFVDRRLLAAGPPSVVRPDVAAQFGDNVAKSGFAFDEIATGPHATLARRLQVVAIADGGASQLKLVRATGAP